MSDEILVAECTKVQVDRRHSLPSPLLLFSPSLLSSSSLSSLCFPSLLFFWGKRHFSPYKDYDSTLILTWLFKIVGICSLYSQCQKAKVEGPSEPRSGPWCLFTSLQWLSHPCCPCLVDPTFQSLLASLCVHFSSLTLTCSWKDTSHWTVGPAYTQHDIRY